MATINGKSPVNLDDAEVRHDEKIVQPDAIVTTLEATGGRPNPFGRGHIKLYSFCLIIYFCSTMNGL
jgi:MFS family permease